MAKAKNKSRSSDNHPTPYLSFDFPFDVTPLTLDTWTSAAIELVPIQNVTPGQVYLLENGKLKLAVQNVGVPVAQGTILPNFDVSLTFGVLWGPDVHVSARLNCHADALFKVARARHDAEMLSEAARRIAVDVEQELLLDAAVGRLWFGPWNFWDFDPGMPKYLSAHRENCSADHGNFPGFTIDVDVDAAHSLRVHYHSRVPAQLAEAVGAHLQSFVLVHYTPELHGKIIGSIVDYLLVLVKDKLLVKKPCGCSWDFCGVGEP